MSVAPDQGADGREAVRGLKGNKRRGGSAWIANGIFVTYTHIVGLAALVLYRPARQTLMLMLAIWLAASFGITMGYHRLWSHRTYTAKWPLRLLLAILGTFSFQGSAKWWSERHRLHHRFTDTEHDPYDARQGFWFSHMGWIFQRPHYPKLPLVDISDLTKDPIVRFQHRHYVPLALFCGFVVPTLVAYFWGDTLGGLLYAGHVTKLMTWHSTFCINSFAHWIGSQEYSLELTARGNLLLALLTQGEGHHNFHHQFPKDYRNGIKWYDYDPTKWLIKLCQMLGLATGLHRAADEDIKRALLLTAEERVKAAKGELDWGPDLSTLPRMTRVQMEDQVSNGQILVIIDGLVYDLTRYSADHPGGSKILKSYAGRDASLAFNGGLNSHTQAARTIARRMVVARLAD